MLLQRNLGAHGMKAQPKGKNKIQLFRQIAKGLVSKIVLHEDVVGIIFLGGLVRGFADRFSDVDIIAILKEKNEHLQNKICNMGLKEKRRTTIDIDLEVHCLEDFKKWKWDETDRWDFSNAKIVHDPLGEINRVFETKLKVHEEFWIKRMVVSAEYMKWYCCPPTDNLGTIVQTWVERGDLLAAHHQLNYAVELLMKVIFALNRKFLPPPKWRIFYSCNLPWLPADYRKLLREAMEIKDLSRKELERRLNPIRKMWREVLPKIERETGLTPAELSRYYVEKVLHQG